MEVQKREKLDLSKWVEGWEDGVVETLAEWDWNEKERNAIGSWEDDAGTDLMKSLKK